MIIIHYFTALVAGQNLNFDNLEDCNIDFVKLIKEKIVDTSITSDATKKQMVNCVEAFMAKKIAEYVRFEYKEEKFFTIKLYLNKFNKVNNVSNFEFSECKTTYGKLRSILFTEIYEQISTNLHVSLSILNDYVIDKQKQYMHKLRGKSKKDVFLDLPKNDLDISFKVIAAINFLVCANKNANYNCMFLYPNSIKIKSDNTISLTFENVELTGLHNIRLSDIGRYVYQKSKENNSFLITESMISGYITQKLNGICNETIKKNIRFAFDLIKKYQSCKQTFCSIVKDINSNDEKEKCIYTFTKYDRKYIKRLKIEDDNDLNITRNTNFYFELYALDNNKEYFESVEQNHLKLSELRNEMYAFTIRLYKFSIQYIKIAEMTQKYLLNKKTQKNDIAKEGSLDCESEETLMSYINTIAQSIYILKGYSYMLITNSTKIDINYDIAYLELQVEGIKSADNKKVVQTKDYKLSQEEMINTDESSVFDEIKEIADNAGEDLLLIAKKYNNDLKAKRSTSNNTNNKLISYNFVDKQAFFETDKSKRANFERQIYKYKLLLSKSINIETKLCYYIAELHCLIGEYMNKCILIMQKI